ncbi:ankyrin repeat-containing protein [Brachyspira pilosicoli P43/6/78]|uniref:Ankyrin repeat-containing protein n=1 Tax=Brachyspira pilosicoli P43/6/78 TaxID=1042417 RepID=A0A3B6VMM3_BRAPL|nr:ankyrin repeat domain-containing protein [Brachyspira pilosicoli]AGA67030.1 ankyrin repeat-containing protein [Brachyspira pilosicoli P43/6/78]
MKYIKYLLVLLVFNFSLFALTEAEQSLFDAVNRKDYQNVSTILSSSPDININASDMEGYTSLHRAIVNNDLNTVMELLKNENIDVNSKLGIEVSIDGWYLGGATPLILASYLGYTDIVNALIEKGVDVKAKDDVDGCMAIHLAAANGKNDVINILLDVDASNINDVDNRGNTPLHWASMKDRADTVSLLIENGADIEAKDIDNWTALHYAAAFASLQTVEALVDNGADKNSLTKDGNIPVNYAKDETIKTYLSGGKIGREDTEEVVEEETTETEETTENTETSETIAEDELNNELDTTQNGSIVDPTVVDLDPKQLELLIAVKNNDIIAVNALLKENVNPNFVDEEGYSPLHRAVLNNNLDVVNVLLSYKDIDTEIKLPYEASVDDWYLGGATPLLVASYTGNADIVNALIEAGSDIRAKDDIDGATTIHIASANGNNEVINILLNKDNTLINEADSMKDTPLHWASIKNQTDTISLLLANGADTKLANSDGNTVLHYAAMYGDVNTVNVLLEADSSLASVENNEGIAPIYYAIVVSDNDILSSIITNGQIDINKKDSLGYTPLHYAANYGNMEAVVLLVEEFNADKTIVNDDNFTASDIAANNSYYTIVEYLGGTVNYNNQNNTENVKPSIVLPEYNKKRDLSKKWW